MGDPETVGALFEVPPRQWGLRGDPYLWRELRSHFARVALPATQDELRTLIEAAFASLTGHAMTAATPFFVERFSHGGMSSGGISPAFWREQAMPLLCARYADLWRGNGGAQA